MVDQTSTPSGQVLTLDSMRWFIQPPRGHQPDQPTPLILFFHGAGGSLDVEHNFNSPDFAAFRQCVFERGFLVAIPEYGGAAWMSPEVEQKVLRGLDALSHQVKINPKRFGVMGVSMGGMGTLTFAAHHPDKVVAACPILPATDLKRLCADMPHFLPLISGAFGGSPQEKPEVWEDRDPLAQAGRLKKVPVMLIHAEDDTLVPMHHSVAVYDKLRTAGGHVELIRVPGVGHSNAVIKGWEKAVVGFFETYAGK